MLSDPHRHIALRWPSARAGHVGAPWASRLLLPTLLAAWLAGGAHPVAVAASAPPVPALPASPRSAPLAPTTPPPARAIDGITRSHHDYAIPPLRLQRADGSQRTLQEALSDGRPVVMTFMYSSCATVCPISNQTLSAFEQWLGPGLGLVNTVSISIDPDHDSVKRLASHARQSGARGSFYTSDPATSEAVQRAFDTWRGDKMNHQPVFLLRRQPGQPWLRLDGLVSPAQLIAEFKRLGQRSP